MFSSVDYSAYKDVIISSGLRAVETADRPPTDFVKEFKDHGIKVIHKCVTTRHAKSAEKMGVDAISLDGFECAGEHSFRAERFLSEHIFGRRSNKKNFLSIYSPPPPSPQATPANRTLVISSFKPKAVVNCPSPSYVQVG